MLLVSAVLWRRYPAWVSFFRGFGDRSSRKIVLDRLLLRRWQVSHRYLLLVFVLITARRWCSPEFVPVVLDDGAETSKHRISLAELQLAETNVTYALFAIAPSLGAEEMSYFK